jgi:nucleotide-binding universal stress UspA family protein
MKSAAARHILVPVDGSSFSLTAIRTAASLAQALKARLTGLHVVAPYASASNASALARLAGFERSVRTETRQALKPFHAEARRLGLRATGAWVVGGEPWRDILEAAGARRCDLIVMASHGRGGLSAALLGSETAKVLTHSKIPVLVCR